MYAFFIPDITDKIQNQRLLLYEHKNTYLFVSALILMYFKNRMEYFKKFNHKDLLM